MLFRAMPRRSSPTATPCAECSCGCTTGLYVVLPCTRWGPLGCFVSRRLIAVTCLPSLGCAFFWVYEVCPFPVAGICKYSINRRGKETYVRVLSRSKWTPLLHVLTPYSAVEAHGISGGISIASFSWLCLGRGAPQQLTRRHLWVDWRMRVLQNALQGCVVFGPSTCHYKSQRHASS